MSLPPWQDPTNPANPSSQVARNMRQDVPKRKGPPTLGDWLITWLILGIFILGIIATLIKQHF